MTDFNSGRPLTSEIFGPFRDTPKLLKATNSSASEIDFGISAFSEGVQLNYAEKGIQQCNIPFPTHLLPGEIRQIVSALHKLSDAPVELCVQSALSRISLVIGGGFNGQHYIHDLPTPTTLAQVSIAESGERKSTVDKLLIAPLEAHIGSLNQSRSKEEQLWPLVADLTPEGLLNMIPLNPAISLSNADAGSFITGYAMERERKGVTASILSSMWSGESLNQLRAFVGRQAQNPRVDISLMAQEVFAQELLGSDLLDGQGFLSRLLIYLPKSLQGKRSAVKALENKQLLNDYLKQIETAGNRLTDIFDQSLDYFDNNLGRRMISLTDEAAYLLAEYNDQLEEMREEGGVLRDNPWGNRAPEHAARLATIFAVYKDKKSVDVEEISAGIGLASHFLHTYLLLKKYFSTGVECREATALWHYLSQRYEIDELIDGVPVLKGRQAKAAKLRQQAEILVGWGVIEIVDRTRNGTVATLKLLAHPD